MRLDAGQCVDLALAALKLADAVIERWPRRSERPAPIADPAAEAPAPGPQKEVE